jgi:hypothetical protein
VWDNQLLWGDSIVWGDSVLGVLEAASVLYGDAILWGTVDAVKVVWGSLASAGIAGTVNVSMQQ